MELEVVKDALSELVNQGRIWAFCPGCRIPLSFKEFKKLKCNVCGKISMDGAQAITFHPKTNQC